MSNITKDDLNDLKKDIKDEFKAQNDNLEKFMDRTEKKFDEISRKQDEEARINISQEVRLVHLEKRSDSAHLRIGSLKKEVSARWSKIVWWFMGVVASITVAGILGAIAFWKDAG